MAISSRATEIVLPTGGRAVILPTNVKDVVTISGSIIGGPSAMKGNLDVIASMCADLLDAGAGKLSKDQYRASLASRGAEVSFGTRGTRLTFSASCFPEDAPFVIARIADALLSPLLPPSELVSEKVRVAAQLDEASANTRTQSELALSRLMYPPTHPNYSPTLDEQRKNAAGASIGALKGVARQYGTAHLALVVVGDVEVKPVREAIEKAFGAARPGMNRPTVSPVTEATRPDARRETILIPNKANADVTLGSALGFGKDDNRFLPSAVVAHMLGGSFIGHLMQTVRDRDGLTYGVAAYLAGLVDHLDGYFELWGTFSPDLLMRGTEALQREASLFLKTGITEQNLADAKTEIAGSYVVALSTTGGLAYQIMRNLEDDRPLGWIDEYPDAIRAITLEEAKDAAAYLESLPLSIATAGSV